MSSWLDLIIFNKRSDGSWKQEIPMISWRGRLDRSPFQMLEAYGWRSIYYAIGGIIAGSTALWAIAYRDDPRTSPATAIEVVHIQRGKEKKEGRVSVPYRVRENIIFSHWWIHTLVIGEYIKLNSIEFNDCMPVWKEHLWNNSVNSLRIFISRYILTENSEWLPYLRSLGGCFGWHCSFDYAHDLLVQILRQTGIWFEWVALQLIRCFRQQSCLSLYGIRITKVNQLFRRSSSLHN